MKRMQRASLTVPLVMPMLIWHRSASYSPTCELDNPLGRQPLLWSVLNYPVVSDRVDSTGTTTCLRPVGVHFLPPNLGVTYAIEPLHLLLIHYM